MKFIATVHVVIEAENEASAAVGIGEFLRNAVHDDALLDWQYLSLGHQTLHPSEYTGPIPIDQNEEA